MNLNIDFKNVFAFLIPVALRGQKFIDWMGALLTPMKSINTIFANEAAVIRYDLAFNGQVIYLQHRLNNDFDFVLRRIYIDDPAGAQVFSFFIWNTIEQQPPPIVWNIAEAVAPKQYLRNFAELIVTGGDFVVFLPASLNTSTFQPLFKRIINQYRPAGKRYTFTSI